MNYLIKFLRGEFVATYSRTIAKMNYVLQIGHLRLRLISIEKVFPDRDWHCPKHSHVYYEFHLIADGKGDVIVNGEKFSVCRGMLFVTGPGIKHTQTSDPGDPMLEYCIKMHIQSIDNMLISDIAGKREADELVKTLAGVYTHPFLDVHDIKSQIDELYKEIELKSPGYTVAFQNKLAQIVNSFYRTVCDEKAQHKTKDHIKRISDFISTNYCKTISVGDLERYMNLSSKQINRLIKKSLI